MALQNISLSSSSTTWMPEVGIAGAGAVVSTKATGVEGEAAAGADLAPLTVP